MYTFTHIMQICAYTLNQSCQTLHTHIQMHSHVGVFFIYEFSPFKVQVEAKQMPFAHFITSTCAIIGGVFTITGLVDSLMYHLFTKRAKKAEMAGTEMQTQ